MSACPTCGHENPDGQKFCGECATPLGAPVRAIPEERKVITSLFCDLIGFTAASESADPEDVDAMLSAYSAMARARIESHGGVMEKFIGDAVVGIFGVPEEAFALLGQGRCLLGLGREPEAVPVLQAAREIFVRLGAAPALAETDALLQIAAALRS
jgi:class 3 adenylate cyclase